MFGENVFSRRPFDNAAIPASQVKASNKHDVPRDEVWRLCGSEHNVGELIHRSAQETCLKQNKWLLIATTSAKLFF